MEKWHKKTKLEGQLPEIYHTQSSHARRQELQGLRQGDSGAGGAGLRLRCLTRRPDALQITAMTDRVVKRTQLVRTPLHIFGQVRIPDARYCQNLCEQEAKEASGEPVYEAEIFDDGDFYHELLKELSMSPIVVLYMHLTCAVDRKTKNMGTDDPIAMGRHWLQVKHLRTKTKKKVDTKASKGQSSNLTVDAH